jgi:hypothetical protein
MLVVLFLQVYGERQDPEQVPDVAGPVDILCRKRLQQALLQQLSHTQGRLM